MVIKMKICVFPGSFDPFTLGHLDIVKRAAVIFDRVYVAIMVNSEKRGAFDFAQRKRIAEVSCADIPNVQVITADGMLCDLCRTLSACAVVKGIRNGADYDYETTLAGVNRHLAPQVETVWIPSSSEYTFICSAFVRELLKYERPLEGVLHPAAIDMIRLDFNI